MIQLLVHIFGDFYLQSPWMALEKHRNSLRCFVHVILYTLCFTILTHSVWALLFIGGTHFLIDRFGLPRYLIWAKNHINPQFKYVPWVYCRLTGYYDADSPSVRPSMVEPLLQPRFITIPIYIVSDNFLHLLCNYLAITYL